MVSASKMQRNTENVCVNGKCVKAPYAFKNQIVFLNIKAFKELRKVASNNYNKKVLLNGTY